MTGPGTACDHFRVLADPTRLALFERIAAAGELAVGELVAGSRVSQPAVSQHLAALRAVGLVAERRVGRRVLYHAPQGALQPLAAWLRRQGHLSVRAGEAPTVAALEDAAAAIDRGATGLV